MVTAVDVLRYSFLPNVGPARGRALMQAFGAFDNLRHAHRGDLMRLPGFSTALAGQVCRAVTTPAVIDARERAVETNLAIAEAMHASLITCVDPLFPAMLREIYDPPLFLFIRGRLPQREDTPLAVVGTRFSSEYGDHAAKVFVRDLSRAGVTIVSGLALGIDTVAHATTIAEGGTTVAVLGSGLNRIYPESNTRLARDIGETGCLVSEHPMNTKPDHVNFPRRNRIISGLSLGVLIVETGVKGGAVITARLAMDQGRDVFAIPGSVFNPHSAGTNALIRDGSAMLVRSADDILAELPPASGPLRPEVPPQQLTLQEQQVFNHLGASPIHIDDLAAQLAQPLSDLLVLLLRMEMNNLVRQLPGKYFTRCG